MELDKIYEKQISITEWFDNIKHARTEELRKEDNDKRTRLEAVNEIIDLPFDKPHSFSANDIVKETFEFKQFVREHGKELCALRLMPTDSTLPKLSMRGKSVRDVLEWFKEQKIDPAKYKADFVPHPENPIWSSIFIVNNKGIFGELIRGGHHQLTQGVSEGEKPIVFSFDLRGWTFSEPGADVREHAQEIVRYICVKDEKKRWLLSKRFDATFLGEYMRGYFETVKSREFGVWFIDYNKTIGELYADFVPTMRVVEGPQIKGRAVSGGKAKGRVRIVSAEEVGKTELSWGDILVCDATTPDYYLLMQQAGGIITSGGGMLSHAAIVARELGKPCIVGVLDATEMFKDGDMIEVDADSGIVKRI